MGSQMVPAIYDPTIADGELTVETEDAFAMCRRLASEEGVFVGPSAAANVVAALRLGRGASSPATVVTILCDGGGKYLSTPIWEDA